MNCQKQEIKENEEKENSNFIQEIRENEIEIAESHGKKEVNTVF